MKFAHKSGIVWKIYLIKLYICSANCPNTIYSEDLPLISVWVYLTKMCI